MKELTNKSIKDLIKMRSEKLEALQAFRFGGAGAKVKNVKEGRNLRKDIARIMTAITTSSKASEVTTTEAN